MISKNSIMRSRAMKYMCVALMVVAMALVYSGCVSTRSTRKIDKIEMGMTKDDIRRLLGSPLYRNAWQGGGEQWGYRKQVGEIVSPEQVLLIVSFDAGGRVIGVETVRDSCPWNGQPHGHGGNSSCKDSGGHDAAFDVSLAPFHKPRCTTETQHGGLALSFRLPCNGFRLHIDIF